MGLALPYFPTASQRHMHGLSRFRFCYLHINSWGLLHSGKKTDVWSVSQEPPPLSLCWRSGLAHHFPKCGRSIPLCFLEKKRQEGYSADCVSNHTAGSAGPASAPFPSPPGAGPPSAAPGSAGTPGAAGPAPRGSWAAAPPVTGTPSLAPAAGWPWPPAPAAAGHSCGASAAAPAGTGAAACGCQPALPAASPGCGTSPGPGRGSLGSTGRGKGSPAAGEPACGPGCGYPGWSRRPVRAGEGQTVTASMCLCSGFQRPLNTKSTTRFFPLNISVLSLSYLRRLTLAFQIGLSHIS